MIVCNSTELDNRHVQEEADEALAATCITQEEHAAIHAAYPVSLYTPNFFIRAGLFLLTLVIVLFTMGLAGLLFITSGTDNFSGLTIFFGLACYAVLELMVQTRKHYRSGTDDALLWLSVVLLLTGIALLMKDPAGPGFFFLGFLLTLYCSLRFTDALMTLAAFVFGSGFLLQMTGSMGPAGLVIAPFLLMAYSGLCWFAARRLLLLPSCRHYHSCLHLLQVLGLLGLYLAGNYYVVRECGLRFFDQYAAPDSSIRLGWFFWTWTCLIPFCNVYFGLRYKERNFLVTGLILIALAVFTIRAYHHVLPTEWALVLAGGVLIFLSWRVTRYLKMPRHGFTAEATDDQSLLQGLPVVESLVIAESFSAGAGPEEGGVQFGGGSGGGGGAGGEY